MAQKPLLRGHAGELMLTLDLDLYVGLGLSLWWWLCTQTQTRPNRLHTYTHPPKRLAHPRSPMPPLSALTSRATHAHPTSPRSTGFCAIWNCISSSSSSVVGCWVLGVRCLRPRARGADRGAAHHRGRSWHQAGGRRYRDGPRQGLRGYVGRDGRKVQHDALRGAAGGVSSRRPRRCSRAPPTRGSARGRLAAPPRRRQRRGRRGRCRRRSSRW